MSWKHAVVSLGFALVGCASTSATLVGSRRYDPLSRGMPVVVYATELDVRQPFETVGIVDYVNPGKYQILTVSDAIAPLKDKARELGANGIIIDQSQATKSGIISTGVSVRARAIRVGPPQS